MKSLLAILLSALLACAAQAQTPPPAAPKVAVTSLVGDAINITSRRERAGTNIASNTTTPIKMPGPLLDLTLLKAAQEALEKTLPAASVAALKVPVAGSSTDPAQVYADGKVAAANVLVDALRQQGFTHLLTVTRHRSANGVRTADGILFGQGLLEGLGFYIDPTISVQRVGTTERVEGVIAPYFYAQLRLVDLNALEVRAVQTIAASSTVGAARNPAGTDAWGALTAEEKMTALQHLIRRHVGEAVPLLFQGR